MGEIFRSALGAVIAAAILANVAFMFSTDRRLTRIELRLGIETAEVRQ